MLTVFSARVQGAEAAEEIAKQVERVGKSDAFDLLVVTRGGGSLEDLWAFNEEKVVRAVAASPLPAVPLFFVLFGKLDRGLVRRQRKAAS